MKQTQRQLANNVRLNDCEPSARDKRKVKNAIECGVEKLRFIGAKTGLKLDREFMSKEEREN